MAGAKIHVRDYWKVIRKRRYTVLTFFIVVFSLVLVGTLSSTPVYMASTKLLIEKVELPSLLMNYSYGSYDPEFYETQYQLIKSSSVSRKVVELLSLDKTYEHYFKDETGMFSLTSAAIEWVQNAVSMVFGTKGTDDIKTKEGEKLSKTDAIAKTVSGGILVRPVRQSKIVEISYMSSNPEFAKLIADTVAKAYIDELLDLNMSSTRATLEWMSKKAEEEKLKVATSEKTLQDFMKENSFLTFDNKMTIMPQKVTDLSSQLLKAETKRKEMEILYSQVKEVSGRPNKAETLSVIASDPNVRSLQDQIIKAEQKVAELSQKQGKKHPTLVRATEELNDLKNQKENAIKRVIESIKNEYELAQSNEAGLRRMLSQTKGEALNLNAKFTQYAALSRDVDTNRQVYDAIIKKVREQGATEQQRTVNVLIIENAESPKVPVKPRKLHNMIIGLIFGLIGGIGTAFFVEYLDNRVKNPEEVETRFGIPVLGIIPLFKSPDSPDKSIEHVVMNEPTSTLAENYKAVRTALLLSSADNPPKRVLITSTGPGEGKTSTAVNLAVAIAQSGHRVLLIDADMRRPRLHKVFGLDNAKGLSTLLAGASDANIIQKGPIPTLSLVTSGPIPPNPSELLSSKRMNAMLLELSGESGNEASKMFADLSSNFDIVVIDSPPLLTVTDALILSIIVDGTILVSSAEKTTYDDLKKGLKSLAGVNAKVIGNVLNAVDLKKADYYYHRYLGYYYSASYEAKK